jgi:hypothetical protein
MFEAGLRKFRAFYVLPDNLCFNLKAFIVSLSIFFNFNFFNTCFQLHWEFILLR